MQGPTEINDGMQGSAGNQPLPRTIVGLGGVAVILAIAIQFGIPLIALTLPPPQRYGFQMYSGYGGVEVIIENRMGEAVMINDLGDYVPKSRPEIDWTSVLPRELCARIATAEVVTVRQSERERIVRCD